MSAPPLPAVWPLRRLSLRLARGEAIWAQLVVAGGGNALGRALGLLFSLALAALFAPAEYGYIRWAISAAMLGAVPAAAGPYALACLLGAARDHPLQRWRTASVGVLAVGGAALLCGALTGAALQLGGRPAGGVLAVLVGMTWFNTAMAVYRGVGAAWHMAALYVGGNLLQLALVLVLCGAWGLALPDLALVAYGFAWLALLALLERRRLGRLVHSVQYLASSGAVLLTLRRLGRLWAPLVVAQVGYTVWSWADVVLVESYLGFAAAGQYALAKTLSMVFILVPEGAALVLLPDVAARGRAATGTTWRLAALTAGVSVGLLAVVLLAAPPLLAQLVEGRYAAAALPLPGVALGMALYAIYLVLEGHVVGLGRAGAHVAGILVMAAVLLGGSALWLPAHGLAGAGLTYAAAALAGLLALGLVGYRQRQREA